MSYFREVFPQLNTITLNSDFQIAGTLPPTSPLQPLLCLGDIQEYSRATVPLPAAPRSKHNTFLSKDFLISQKTSLFCRQECSGILSISLIDTTTLLGLAGKGQGGVSLLPYNPHHNVIINNPRELQEQIVPHKTEPRLTLTTPLDFSQRLFITYSLFPEHGDPPVFPEDLYLQAGLETQRHNRCLPPL